MQSILTRRLKSLIILFFASTTSLFFFCSYSNLVHNFRLVDAGLTIFDTSTLGLGDHGKIRISSSSAATPMVMAHTHKDEVEGSQYTATLISTSGPTEAPSPPSPLTGAIVAAVGSSANLTWLSEIQDPMWKTHRYNHDAPTPDRHFPANKGNEAMMYLSYIINNYDSLPDYSIFIHGHQLAWHQEGDMASMISALRLRVLDNEGYISMRCDWNPSCPREIRPIDRDAVVWGPGVKRNETEEVIGAVWPILFPDEELPHTIASQCCAQFAVTRSAIQGRSKVDYERMRQWLVDTPLINDISGRVFEKLWAYIFTKKAVNCPPPPLCACEYFSMCEKKQWPVPPPGLEKWDDAFD